MPDFSIYFLTPAERILARNAIQAGSEREAITIGLDALHHWNIAAIPTRRAFAVEIWCGANRVCSQVGPHGQVSAPSMIRTIGESAPKRRGCWRTS